MKSNEPKISFSDKNFTWQDGKNWFNQGIIFFKLVKNMWYVSCLVMGVLFLLLASVALPLVAVLVIFASPMVTAFIMNCCQAVRLGQPLQINMLWQDVFKQLNYFLLLGLFSALLSMVMQQVHVLLLSAYELPLEMTEEMAMNMSGAEALLRVLFNLITNLPVALALAFSPALILFKRAHPVNAIKFSVLAVLRSWKAFIALVLLIVLVFFGVLILASIVGSVVLMVMGSAGQLVANVLVLFFVFTVTGIGLCSQYQAFTELFADDEQEPESEDTEVYAEI
ncbi:BPSS1780 family membrane protein [Marinicella sp. S1101]|uniref:BPSS1780 family membrane protein n=1 Tax=Marinicella marina TaxID=2996016 RepID=UPI002260A179|nr:BPSS1780 family membrane protein [Marinicella marina]MCX7554667.1 BPSS1780 family membrane protein [Marinicella marina]MDJ1140732.1 BPSS1780 family membrane protein [Marinicella marina]